MSKEKNRINREQEIKEVFKLNKLEFKNYGEVYSYINYGKPDIETIIKNELTKLADKNKRRLELSNELNKLNIPFDETFKACYEYINNIGTKDFIDIIRSIEIEYFLKTKTNYIELRKKYDRKTAQDMAMMYYSEKESMPKNIVELNTIKVCFE